MRVKEIEVYNRPREKMLREGVEKLTNEELLAILIGSGVKNNSVLDISKELLEKYGSFSNILNCDIYSLMNIKGLKVARAIIFVTISEIFKRMKFEVIDLSKSFNSADDVYELLKEELQYEKQEMFVVLYMNVKLKIIKKEVLFKGGINNSLVDINLIFKNALMCGAKNIICIHNHPSGDSTPSIEDIELTKSVKSMSKIAKVNLVDHIIIGNNNYFSFKKSNI